MINYIVEIGLNLTVIFLIMIIALSIAQIIYRKKKRRNNENRNK